MNFDYTQLNRFGNAVFARGSPTNDLLEAISNKNVTVLQLFLMLRKMKHYRAMLILKPYGEYKLLCISYGSSSSCRINT